MHDRPILTKSYKSAVVMSAIAVIPSLSVLATFEFVLNGLPDPGNVDQTVAIVGAALLVAILFIVLPAAFIVFRLDVRHFGLQGAVRWFLMGILLGLFLSLPYAVLLPRRPADPVLVRTLCAMARGALAAGALYLSHWIAFRLPFSTRRAGSHDGPGPVSSTTETEGRG